MSKSSTHARDIQQYVNEYNKLFTELHKKLIKKLNNQLNHANNFVDFISCAIQLLTQESVSLHGFQKKEMVIDLVKGVVETMKISDEDKEILKKCVFPTLDNTVDLFIAAAKGYMFLNETADIVEDGCTKCQAKCNGSKCFGCRHSENKRSKKNRSTSTHKKAPLDMKGNIDITALSDIVYDKVKEMITHKQVTIANVIGIVTLAMQMVQQFAGVSGTDKKKIVISVVHRLLNEIPMDEADKFAIQVLVDVTLDKTIDFVVGIANGDIDLLGVMEETVTRCKIMCGC